MTWDELAILITCVMSDEQRNSDVTIHCTESDEFFGVYDDGFVESKEDDVLDKGHPFLEIPF